MQHFIGGSWVLVSDPLAVPAPRPLQGTVMARLCVRLHGTVGHGLTARFRAQSGQFLAQKW